MGLIRRPGAGSTRKSLLSLILGQPDREWTLEELAASSRELYQTVGNEVRRLQGAGLVAAVRTVGRSKFLRANTASPYFGPLAQLVLMPFGPPVVVSEELATLRGVDQAFIYGSWAARWAGEPVPVPNDVDVLLVGVPDRDEAYDAAARAQERFGREVNVKIRSVARWEKDQDGFTVQLRSSPLLLVPPPPVAVGPSPAARGSRDLTSEYPQPRSYDPIEPDEAADAVKVAKDCLASAGRLLELDQLGIF